MEAVLIDTNVLIYACDPRDSKRQEQALRILDALDIARTGRLSVQCLSEFFSATIRTRQPLFTISEAIRQTEFLLQTFPVFDLTPLIVLEAARGVREFGMSFFDAQIWASARLNQVSIVLSEDFSSGQIIEGVRFVNPFAKDFDFAEWD